MSVLDFPTSPTNGQFYNGFIWNAANETWDSSFAPRPATIPLVGYNAIINGGFDIWQRGTSAVNSQNAYLADRWRNSGSATGFSVTQSRVAAPFVADVPFALRTEQATGAATSISEYAARQIIERSNVEAFAGNQVVLSFWYRSNRVGTHGVRLVGVGTGAGDWTTSITVTTANTWAKYSVTSSVPFGSITSYGSTAPTDPGAYVDIGFKVGAGPGFTALSAGDYFELTGVQLEIGAAPTEFRRNAPSIQGELAACQRYYQVLRSGGNLNGGTEEVVGMAMAYSTTAMYASVPFLVEMRAMPVISVSNGANHFMFEAQGTADLMDTLNTVIFATRRSVGVGSTNQFGGFTAGISGWLRTNNTAAFIVANAEL
jgi:hypothetical protein